MATIPDLLAILGSGSPVRPMTLRAELGISPQTLGRLIAEAGDELLRMGKARSIRYARTRAVEGLGRSVPVSRVDEAGTVASAGTLRLLRGGRTFWEKPDGGTLFEGLPPALVDMAPQGFLGRAFPARFPELGLPPSISDWSDDHRLVALAARGEDCVGDLIVGDESLRRFAGNGPSEVDPRSYPGLAGRSAAELVGSSAGGERPKFGAFSEGRHVLVKYAARGDEGASRRWRDLLWCEWKALATVAEAGRGAAQARWMDEEGWRFLEVERFDRVGARGRRAVLSLAALNNEYLGTPDSWTAGAELLRRRPFLLPPGDVENVRWLDLFGQLVGNTDRHFGNLTFLLERDGTLRLAPSYDMLPMILAPSGEVVVPRAFEPAAPRGNGIDVWRDAATWAVKYWHQVGGNVDLDDEVRRFATRAADAIGAMGRRLGPG
ncbi:MAG: type II toxin-antitoxin system HipA family toxin YjjJ [Deltaproteobacteria bacterium]